jgi:NADH:ubiquinone oxidoreductase subunit F (NADH-binding)/NADH:ubiquinone oxidoreductase subunit E
MPASLAIFQLSTPPNPFPFLRAIPRTHLSMSDSSAPTLYQSVLVPALLRIQEEHGYLKREALEAYSERNQVPLHRLQSVASFFPHFKLSPPKTVTVRVCRDMACHLACSKKLSAELANSLGKNVAVEGVSCLGRCDRAPAVAVSVQGHPHESLLLGRSNEEVVHAVQGFLSGATPHSDHDADLPNPLANCQVDPYPKTGQPYAAVRKVLTARNASLDAAGIVLSQQFAWNPERIAQFRLAAIQQLRDAEADHELRETVRAWQTESNWAKGPTLGGWAEGPLAELNAADLRGMGGAGIPATQKWRDVRDAVRRARLRDEDDRAFIVVNGDESEPGTFKDRELLLRTPHLVVEGVILAGLLTEATQGFIYIRHEYGEQIEACRREIERAEQLGLCGLHASQLGRPFPISVFVSPGGYICGEQSALIEAMSDRRGEPRNMPPKLETNGLDDLPTLVSNVETYAWTPFIQIHGGKTYSEHGVNGCKGLRIFSISGDVARPGVYEVPMGLTLRELIHGKNYCQGMKDGLPLKGFAPSGPSGGFLPAKLRPGAGLPREHVSNPAWIELAKRRGFDPNAQELDLLDLELELNVFRALSPTQALGAGLVVYAEGRDMLEQAANSLDFFRNESCGKCVPCRLGSQKMAALAHNLLENKISKSQWESDLGPLSEEMGRAIELASICGLGRSVPVPLKTVGTLFRSDLAAHLK